MEILIGGGIALVASFLAGGYAGYKYGRKAEAAYLAARVAVETAVKNGQ